MAFSPELHPTDFAASVVVPSRGGAQRLPVLFEALRHQDTTNFEVVVVLDGDVDSSRSVVEAEQERGALSVSLVEFPENRGRVSALNAGFEAARGWVLIRCDDDFEPDPWYVSRHVVLHEQGPVGVIGMAKNVISKPTFFSRLYSDDADRRHHEEALTSDPETRWRYWAGNVSVDAETYRAVGPYSTVYRTYGWEDVDWGYRLHCHGVPIIIDEQLTTRHHAAAVTVHTRARRAYQSGAAMRTFLREHPEQENYRPVAWSPWMLAVRAVALVPPQTVFKVATGLDSLGERLPPSIARRFVSLLVEGSALGGRRRPRYNDTEI